jgi:glycine hydroxymethyltransferase
MPLSVSFMHRWVVEHRLGMHEVQMETIADLIARVLVEGAAPEQVMDEVVAFRKPYQVVYFCFEHGLPA